MAEKKWVVFEELPKEVQQAARLKSDGRRPIGVAWQNDSRVGRFGDIFHNWRTDKMEVVLVDRNPDGSVYPYRMVFDWHEWNGKFPDADLSWLRCWKKEARVPVPFTADFCPMCGDRIIQPQRDEEWTPDWDSKVCQRGPHESVHTEGCALGKRPCNLQSKEDCDCGSAMLPHPHPAKDHDRLVSEELRSFGDGA